MRHLLEFSDFEFRGVEKLFEEASNFSLASPEAVKKTFGGEIGTISWIDPEGSPKFKYHLSQWELRRKSREEMGIPTPKTDIYSDPRREALEDFASAPSVFATEGDSWSLYTRGDEASGPTGPGGKIKILPTFSVQSGPSKGEQYTNGVVIEGLKTPTLGPGPYLLLSVHPKSPLGLIGEIDFGLLDFEREKIIYGVQEIAE